MPINATRRYQATYRQNEIDLIVRFALRGESLALVGPAGMGKSNIVNFLREINQHAPHLEQNTAQLHFPIVDATYWENTPLSLWKIMLDALNQAIQSLAPPPLDEKIISIAEEERILNTVRSRLQWVCQELNHQVMFVLDDFDAVLETGPLAMLERLNGLRSEGNREAMSFLIFSKRLPHVLGRNYDLEHDSKFYDLFRAHVYALEPYTAEDAHQMLQHLNEVADSSLPERDLAVIRQLVGGHARLLKIVFDLWAGEGMAGVNPLTQLVEQPDVQQECRRILHSLHEDEQAVLVRAALNALTPADQELANHLARRGLLMADTQKLFSPLLGQFLAQFGEQE